MQIIERKGHAGRQARGLVGRGWIALGALLMVAAAGCHPGEDCSPDADGALCVLPANPCHVGAMTCSGGSADCADTGTLLPNGASCGADLVCSGGTCIACTSGSACSPVGSCHTGILDCSNGTPTCAQQAELLSDGAPCGSELVCNQGRCLACAAGSSCTTGNPCAYGLISCDTGLPICTDAYPFGDGTYCDTNSVCLSGNCVSCSDGGLYCGTTSGCMGGACPPLCGADGGAACDAGRF
jgi:hypothetical protein